MYPDAHCELDFTTPLELLVATILSAQCDRPEGQPGDPRVVRRYRPAADYAAADPQELENIIRPTGFFRTKARHIGPVQPVARPNSAEKFPTGWRIWSHCRVWAARPPTWCWATLSVFPVSPSTPTSDGLCAALGMDPRRTTRRKSEQDIVACSRPERVDDGIPPADLARPPDLPCPAAPRAAPANSSTCAPPTVKDRWTRRPRGGWYGRGRSHETADHYSSEWLLSLTEAAKRMPVPVEMRPPASGGRSLRGPAAVRGRRSRA